MAEKNGAQFSSQNGGVEQRGFISGGELLASRAGSPPKRSRISQSPERVSNKVFCPWNADGESQTKSREDSRVHFLMTELSELTLKLKSKRILLNERLREAAKLSDNIEALSKRHGSVREKIISANSVKQADCSSGSWKLSLEKHASDLLELRDTMEYPKGCILGSAARRAEDGSVLLRVGSVVRFLDPSSNSLRFAIVLRGSLCEKDTYNVRVYRNDFCRETMNVSFNQFQFISL